MRFKYHAFEIDITDFDAEYCDVRDSLLDFMWEEHEEDYREYLARRRESFEVEDKYQREHYGSYYNISFGMDCAKQDYYNRIHQECDWVLERWQERFNGIEEDTEEKAPRKRKNALTGRF